MVKVIPCTKASGGCLTSNQKILIHNAHQKSNYQTSFPYSEKRNNWQTKIDHKFRRGQKFRLTPESTLVLRIHSRLSSDTHFTLHCYRIDAWAIRRPWLTFMKGHSLPNSTAMSPLVTDFDDNLRAYRADHSEQNDVDLSKIGPAVPKTQEFENWLFLWSVMHEIFLKPWHLFSKFNKVIIFIIRKLWFGW